LPRVRISEERSRQLVALSALGFFTMLRRRVPTLLVALAGLTWFAVLAFACSSTSSSLACGPGTERQGNECVPTVTDAGVLPDAANDADGGANSDAALPPEPPRFAGVADLAPMTDTSLLAVWAPAVDAIDPRSPVAYRVYVAPSGQAIDYTSPAVVTAAGALSAVIGGLRSGTTYDVVVRAVGLSGVEDGNTHVLSAAPAADTTPPTFAGLTSATTAGSGAIALAWGPAMDTQTPADAMTYLVFMSSSPGAENFATPVAVSDPGVTTITIEHLAGATQLRYFVVLARDAAGNLSSLDGGATERSATPGPDTVPPQFGGCVAAAKVGQVSIALSWQPAVDDVSLPANIKYQVLASTAPGVIKDFSSLATATGDTQVVIPNLTPSTRYYFICRAVDEAGNVDDNTAEVTALTGSNPLPPTFVTGVTIQPGQAPFTATLAWDTQATDPVTPQNAIVYDVYWSTQRGGERLDGVPQQTSSAGASSILLSNLTPNSTLYFVVCARDLDGNRACAKTSDGGSDEVSLVTPVSFAQNISPVFAHNCGVVGCHVPGNPSGRLNLATGFAYAAIVNVQAFEATPSIALKADASLPPGMNPALVTTPGDGGPSTFTLNYVTPTDVGDSYLYIKTHQTALTQLMAVASGNLGTLMPAPVTGTTLSQADLDAIASWIEAGAPNN
jgi:hypothetical protein